WVALVVSPIVVGAVGAITEVVVLRPLYGKEHLLQLLATFGLLYFFQGIALLIWGGQYYSIDIPSALLGHVAGLGNAYPLYNFFIMGITAVVGLFMWWLLQRTQLGWRIRA